MDLNKKQTTWVRRDPTIAELRAAAEVLPDAAPAPPAPPAPQKNDTAAESPAATVATLPPAPQTVNFMLAARRELGEHKFQELYHGLVKHREGKLDNLGIVTYVGGLLSGYNHLMRECARLLPAGYHCVETRELGPVFTGPGLPMAAAPPPHPVGAASPSKGSHGAPPVQEVCNSMNQVVVRNAPAQETTNQVALTNQGSVLKSNQGATDVVMAENKRLATEERKKKDAKRHREMRRVKYVQRTIDRLGKREEEIEYLDLTPEALDTLNGAEIVGKKVNNAKDKFKWIRAKQLSLPGRIEKRHGSGSLVTSTLNNAVVVQPHGSKDPIAIDSSLIKRNKVCWCKTSAAQKQGAIANQLTGAIGRDNGVGYCLVYYPPSGETHWANENYLSFCNKKEDRKSKPPDFFGYVSNQVQSNDDRSRMQEPSVSAPSDIARLKAVYDKSRAAAKESPLPQAVREAVSDEKICKGGKKTDIERLANASLLHDTLHKAYSGFEVSKHTELQEVLGGEQQDYVSSMTNLGPNAEISQIIVQQLVISKGEDYDKKPPPQPTKNQKKRKCEFDGCSSNGHSITRHKFCFRHAPPEFKKKCQVCNKRYAGRHGQRCRKCTPDEGKGKCPGCDVRLPRQVNGYCSTCIRRLPVSVRRACRNCNSEDHRIGKAGGLCSTCSRSKHVRVVDVHLPRQVGGFCSTIALED